MVGAARGQFGAERNDQPIRMSKLQIDGGVSVAQMLAAARERRAKIHESIPRHRSPDELDRLVADTAAHYQACVDALLHDEPLAVAVRIEFAESLVMLANRNVYPWMSNVLPTVPLGDVSERLGAGLPNRSRQAREYYSMAAQQYRLVVSQCQLWVSRLESVKRLATQVIAAYWRWRLTSAAMHGASAQAAVARTYDDGTPEWRNAVQETIRRFEEAAAANPEDGFPRGRMKLAAARCQYALGELATAAESLERLRNDVSLDWGGLFPFEVSFQREILVELMRVWCDPKANRPSDAIRAGELSLENEGGSENSRRRIHGMLARAYELRANQAKGEEKKADLARALEHLRSFLMPGTVIWDSAIGDTDPMYARLWMAVSPPDPTDPKEAVDLTKALESAWKQANLQWLVKNKDREKRENDEPVEPELLAAAIHHARRALEITDMQADDYNHQDLRLRLGRLQYERGGYKEAADVLLTVVRDAATFRMLESAGRELMYAHAKLRRIAKDAEEGSREYRKFVQALWYICEKIPKTLRNGTLDADPDGDVFAFYDSGLNHAAYHGDVLLYRKLEDTARGLLPKPQVDERLTKAHEKSQALVRKSLDQERNEKRRSQLSEVLKYIETRLPDKASKKADAPSGN
jgi:hypothetical protein